MCNAHLWGEPTGLACTRVEPHVVGHTQARPNQADVDALRELLDLMENFPDNDQRARYLLTCNWMRNHVEQLRDARDRAERRIEAVEALADKFGATPDWNMSHRNVAQSIRTALGQAEGVAP